MRLAEDDQPLRRDPAAERDYVKALDVALEWLALEGAVAEPSENERSAIDERLKIGGSMRARSTATDRAP